MLIIILVVLACMILPAVASPETAEKKHSWIYRTDNTPLMSNNLGVGTLPVLVIIKGRRLPGLYITTPITGLAQEMSLTKGSVLLTVDGYTMASAHVVDNWLNQRPLKPLKYAFAVWKDGCPRIYENKIPFKRTSPEAAAPEVGAAGRQPTLDELERYGLTLINDSRKSEGRTQVQIDPALSRLARSYADYMLQHVDQYGFPLRRNPHIDLEGRMPLQRAFAAGIIKEVHENLGMESRSSTSDSQLVLRQHQKMMSEPPDGHNHRTILMDSEAHTVGVGISRDQTHLFLVEEFAH